MLFVLILFFGALFVLVTGGLIISARREHRAGLAEGTEDDE